MAFNYCALHTKYIIFPWKSITIHKRTVSQQYLNRIKKAVKPNRWPSTFNGRKEEIEYLTNGEEFYNVIIEK